MPILTNKKVVEHLLPSLNELSLCKEWFENNGFQFSVTRFNKALEILKRLSTPAKNGDLTSDELWQIIELYDLYEAYRNLKDINSEKLVLTLKKSLKGFELLSNENKTTARDFFFELKVATKLIKSGIEVDFDTESDLSAKFDYCNYNIECKRIQSMNGLKSNINKAKKQLDTRSKHNINKIIAIDFSKVFYKEYCQEAIEFSTDHKIRQIRKIIDSKFPCDVEKNHIDVLKKISIFIGHVRLPVLLKPFKIVSVNHFFTINMDKSSCSELILSKIRSSVGSL